MSENFPHLDNEVNKRQLFAEFFGTFSLVYIGGMSVLMGDLGYVGVLGVAIQHTFTIAFAVWGAAGISGGHLNGAISLGFWVSRQISLKKCLLYNLAQTLGSFAAGGLLKLHVWTYKQDKSVFASKLGFPHADVNSWGTYNCFIMEALATGILVFMVCITAVNKTRPKNEVFGMAIGGTVGMFVLCIGPITGASLNPQRILGPAVISAELWQKDYDYAYIYYGGDYLGGAIAGMVWYLLFVDWNRTECEKDLNYLPVKVKKDNFIDPRNYRNRRNHGYWEEEPEMK